MLVKCELMLTECWQEGVRILTGAGGMIADAEGILSNASCMLTDAGGMLVEADGMLTNAS
jgi:hypothetical protein